MIEIRKKIENLSNQGIDNIYIYPFGNRGVQIYNFVSICFDNIKIVCVDDNLSKYNKKIIPYKEMKRAFEDNTINKKAIVLLCSDNSEIYQELRNKVASDIAVKRVVDLFEWNPLCFIEDKRISSLAMAGKQIYENHIEGAVAEAGVYKGDFARYINMIFPDRELYLFDTFEGFVKEQVNDKRDNLSQTDIWINTLKDSAVDEVLKKTPYKDKVKICKGIFPDTAYDIRKKFAFVNLDMDLYYPIYKGLCFFWEHLTPGGIIFVHDYRNWDGVTIAVKKFCEEMHTGYIWLNDRVTVALSKPLESCNEK